MESDILADYWLSLKESEKLDKYLELTRDMKKLWNIKVTVVPVVVRALGIISGCLAKSLEEVEIHERIEHLDDGTAKNGSEYWGKYESSEETCCRMISSVNHLLLLM